MADSDVAVRAAQDQAPAPAIELAVPPAPVSVGARPSVVAAAEEAGHSALDRRLTREILISERLRVQLLAAIPGLALIVFLALAASYPDTLDRAFQGKMDRLRVGLLLGGFAVYELMALSTVERLIKSGREPPPLRRYVNALVETSLPTAVLVYYMTIGGEVEALLLPPVFIYFVFILLSTLRLEFLLCLFTGAVAAVEYGALALWAVEHGDYALLSSDLVSVTHHMGKAAILLVCGVAAGFVARRLRRAFVNTLESVEEQNRIRGLFGQHVSPAVVDELLARKADVRSEVREVCVMFLDVRDFTTFAEKKSPEEVVDYLNSLFEFMIEAINQHGGIVNKFLGDGFMAVFGAPLSDGDDCRNAVDASLTILQRLEELTLAGAIPPTRVGIALHAGGAVIGNVGSAQRKEYTVIGDVVNVASRVEALNKDFGSQLLVTERVWEAAGRPEGAIAKEPLRVRGRAEPLKLLQLA